MKVKAFVVVDTNVLISATLTPSNAPFKIVEIFDRRMLDEYLKEIPQKNMEMEV